MKDAIKKARELLGGRYHRILALQLSPDQTRELHTQLDRSDAMIQAERIIVRGQVMFPYDMYFGCYSDQWHRMMAHPEALTSEQIRGRLKDAGFEVGDDPEVEQLEAIGFVNLNPLSGP